jgi:hypothetical protein
MNLEEKIFPYSNLEWIMSNLRCKSEQYVFILQQLLKGRRKSISGQNVDREAEMSR